MGHGRGKAVADAGPLIHLTEINSLALLEIFESVIVPDSVWLEAQAHHPLSHPAPSNLMRITVSQAEVEASSLSGEAPVLHRGEMECLFLCRRMSARILLTDDLAARDAARRLGVTPVGSLGIVVRAFRLGLISLLEAQHLLEDLYDQSSLFVTRAIVEIALDQLEKHR